MFNMAGKLCVILLVIQGVLACGKLPTGPHFIQEGLDGDIILALPAEPHESARLVQWEIQSAHGRRRDLTTHFAVEEEGPIAYLMVSKALRLNQVPRKTAMNVAVSLVCKSDEKKEVYTIQARVISENLLQKIVLQVPENTAIGTIVYKQDKRLQKDMPKFQMFATKQKSLDANQFFHIDSKTGAIFVDNRLDYESSFKLLKLNTVQRNRDKISKIFIFWIKITNINDNRPEIFLRDCPKEHVCNAKKYTIEARQNGKLFFYNGSSLAAMDGDGDTITFSIVKVNPEIFRSVCVINRNTGELYMRRIESLPAKTEIHLTVEATDGKFVDAVDITIKVNMANTSGRSEGDGPLVDDSFERVPPEPSIDLHDLPAWFQDEDDANARSQALRTTASSENEIHMKQIRDQCSASVFVSKLSFSELASLLNVANTTVIEEFCDNVQANKGNSTSALNYGEIVDEVLTICDKMPREVLSLTGFLESFENGTDLVEFCLNSTSTRWFNGSVTMRSISEEIIDGHSSSGRADWYLFTSAILLVVTWALTRPF